MTPPRWGEIATRTLPNSRHLVVPYTGHGALDPCTVGLMTTFVRTADARSLDAGCLAQIPAPFSTPSAAADRDRRD